jgi:hypothetical protein
VKFQHSGYVLVGGVTEPVWRVGEINPVQLISGEIIEDELKRTAGGRGRLKYRRVR